MTEPRRARHHESATETRDGRLSGSRAATPEAALDTTLGAVNDAALAPLSLYRSLAQESLHFWARRLQAYAEWAEAAASSQSPLQLMEAQTAFMARIQKDYAAESTAMASLVQTGLSKDEPTAPE